MVDKVIVSDVKSLCAEEPIEDMEIAMSRRALEGTECMVFGEKLVWVDQYIHMKFKLDLGTGNRALTYRTR
jgi:hypothetical protein